MTPRLNPVRPDKEQEQKPEPKTRAGATEYASRSDAVKATLEPLAAAIREVVGQPLQIAVLDVVFRTEVISTRNGRFILPDDLDETVREQLEFQMRFVPLPKP